MQTSESVGLEIKQTLPAFSIKVRVMSNWIHVQTQQVIVQRIHSEQVGVFTTLPLSQSCMLHPGTPPHWNQMD